MTARSLKSSLPGSFPARCILLIDDHAVFRHGLKSILQDHFNDAVFTEAENGLQALDLCRDKWWDAAVLDITLPDRSGLEILQQLKAQQPDLRVLVLSMHAEEHYALRVLRAGAAGYISKSKAAREIVDAVGQVIAGQIYLSPALSKRVVDLLNRSCTHPHQILTDRELEVMRLVATGKSPKQIASDLGVSIQTVSTHRASILRKMRFENPVQLIRYAIEQNLVE